MTVAIRDGFRITPEYEPCRGKFRPTGYVTATCTQCGDNSGLTLPLLARQWQADHVPQCPQLTLFNL